MSYIAAGAAILSLAGSYMGAQAAKAASRLEGDEFDLSAMQTLLTARFNMGNIVQSGMIDRNSILEQGADRESMLERVGNLRMGKTVATLGASGVRMDSGTANQQIIKSGLDSAGQILANQEELNAAINGLEFNTDQKLLETKTKALMDYKKLKRMGDLARAGGNTGQFGRVLDAIGGAAGTYSSLGGDFTEFGGGQKTGGKVSSPGRETGGSRQGKYRDF